MVRVLLLDMQRVRPFTKAVHRINQDQRLTGCGGGAHRAMVPALVDALSVRGY